MKYLITLGTDLHRFRTAYLILSSVMVGFAVYCAGVIGFVGLVIPHVGKNLVWNRSLPPDSPKCSAWKFLSDLV